MATVELEHVILLETALIDEHIDALAGGVLAACVLFVNGFLTAAELCLLALGDQLLDLLCLNTHNIFILCFDFNIVGKGTTFP